MGKQTNYHIRGEQDTAQRGDATEWTRGEAKMKEVAIKLMQQFFL